MLCPGPEEKIQFTKPESCSNTCLVLRQIGVELIRIDFLTQNQYIFDFQNQVKG